MITMQWLAKFTLHKAKWTILVSCLRNNKCGSWRWRQWIRMPGSESRAAILLSTAKWSPLWLLVLESINGNNCTDLFRVEVKLQPANYFYKFYWYTAVHELFIAECYSCKKENVRLAHPKYLLSEHLQKQLAHHWFSFTPLVLNSGYTSKSYRELKKTPKSLSPTTHIC